MGYTHYWENESSFDDKSWKRFVDDVKRVLHYTDVPLAGGSGKVGTKPEIGDNFICFNGVGDDAHEACYITKAATKFSYCKTGYAPYDKKVVVVLKLLKRYNPSTKLMSDGENVFKNCHRR